MLDNSLASTNAGDGDSVRAARGSRHEPAPWQWVTRATHAREHYGPVWSKVAREYLPVIGFYAWGIYSLGLALLEGHQTGRLSQGNLRELTGLAESTIRQALRIIIRAGLARIVGEPAEGQAARYEFISPLDLDAKLLEALRRDLRISGTVEPPSLYDQVTPAPGAGVPPRPAPVTPAPAPGVPPRPAPVTPAPGAGVPPRPAPGSQPPPILGVRQ